MKFNKLLLIEPFKLINLKSHQFCSNNVSLDKSSFDSNDLQKSMQEKAKSYSNLIDKHYKLNIPYLDHSVYKELLISSKTFSQNYYKEHNEYLESFYILEKYLTLNINTISPEDFVEYVEEFSKVKFFRFEFWYYVEKHILKNISQFNNQLLSRLIYNLSYAEKGSNYLWICLAERILEIQPKNFNETEFILIFNSFKTVKIEHKLLWAFLNRTLIEVYPSLNDLDEKDNELKV